MKKLFFMLIALLYINAAKAQESDEHLMFMGIPIDGEVVEFVSKLQQKGLNLINTDKEIATLNGNFAGENCEIYVIYSPTSSVVSLVTVFFPKNNSWSSIKSDFNQLKDDYTHKYGQPKNNYDFFIKPYYEGDGYEMQAIRNDKCRYVTVWNLEHGNIWLEIGDTEQVIVRYYDKTNEELRAEEKSKSVRNDI